MIPASQEMRKPLLEAFKGEAPRNFLNSEILELIAEKFGLTLNNMSSGDKNLLKSRVNEAKVDLKKHNLLSNPSGYTYMITNTGTEVLEEDPPVISDDYLSARQNKTLPVAETFGLESPEIEPVPEEAVPEEEVPVEIEPEPEPEDEEVVVEDVQDEENEEIEAELEPEPETITETEPLPEASVDEEEVVVENTPLSLQDIPPSQGGLEETLPPLASGGAGSWPCESEAEGLEKQSPEPEPETETEEVVELETETEIEPEPEDFAGEEFDEAPEEILDTEEEYTEPMELMSEELENEQIHEELPPAEPEPEPEPEVEVEPEDDSFLEDVEIPSTGIDDVIDQHNSELADELLMKVAGLPSDRFEILVIDLLSKMGYFAFQTARYTTESSGSDLIHGVILDHKTGANIYIQARKLSPGRTIGRADIQDFIDELSDKGGKGILATTASFSENARILANDERIMLIDGEKLASLMIANNFCVSVEKVYEIKAIDAESFSEYEE